ncbi:MAG: hypothetical protein QOF83_1381 [Solirubrobacteraceae bacterium]|nr:hypothetical protein [Solirubrobacteraceae bacterium]
MSGGELAVAVPRSARQALRCPDCRLVITSLVLALSPRHCPRCLAHRRVAVGLEGLSTPAASDGTNRGPAMNGGVE